MSVANWNSFAYYAIGDKVIWTNGSIYQAAAANQNVPPQPPTAEWTLVPSGGGGITNPLTENLLGGGFDIQNVGTNTSLTFYGVNVGTEFLTLPPVSLASRIEVGNALQINPVGGAATRFLVVPPECAVGPSGPDDLCNKAYVDSVPGAPGPTGPTGPAGPVGPPAYGVFAFSASPPHGVDEWFENALNNWGFSNTGTQSNQDWLLALGSASQSLQPVFLTLVQGSLSQTVKVVSVAPDVGFTYVEYLSAVIPPGWVDGAETACYYSIAGNDGATGPTGPEGPTGPAGPTPAISNTYYVGKNGSDSTGDGSIAKPFLTIQNAITVAQTGLLPSSANPCAIYVAPGRYTEDLTLTDGYTTIVGLSETASIQNGVTLVGTITITATGASDLFGRTFAFQGLTVLKLGAGTAVADTTTTTEHSVTFTNCKIQASERAVHLTSGAETRNVFQDSQIQNDVGYSIYTAPLFEIGGTSSWLEMIRCDLTAKNTQSDCITFSGTSYPYRIALSTFISSSASATANPIMRYSTTQSAVGSIGQSVFVYESSTNKAANNPTSSGIFFDTGSFVYPSATPVLQVLQNIFILNGLASTTLFCIGKRSTTTGTPIITTSANGTAPSLASKIQTGGAIVHLPYNTLS
jgi:hypothetical protein